MWTNAALLYLQQCPQCKGKRVYVMDRGVSVPTSGFTHTSKCPSGAAVVARWLKKWRARPSRRMVHS